MELDWEAVGTGFAIKDIDLDNLPIPTFSVVPHQTIGVIAQGRDGNRHLTGGHWSFVPRWSPTMKLRFTTYNARMEAAPHTPTYMEATHSARAIIPASGYFEFNRRTPFYFHDATGAPLSMAGLYSWWRGSSAAPWTLTATILTCYAIEGPATVHNRMPLLVPDDMVDDWLDPFKDGAPQLRAIYEGGKQLSSALDFYEVAPLKGTGPKLIEPVHHQQPLSLF
ncbi:Putative SOS response-associated peptidase YedK [Bifidobacterium bohemicum]|nr:Putative SOS response-associated peptidase YedK [Bifidobacterium bohemicum]